jgi:ParB family transcriptional regulator, chromosome partitioning protein
MLIKKIAIKDIKLRDYNRDQITDASVRELADSIAESGLLQPILVSIAPAGSKHFFDLVAGERRIRACKLLGAVEIDAHVTTMDAVTQEKANLTENLQRQDLTVWEESKHLAKLKELQPEARVEDLSAQLGRGSTWVAQRLAMSKLLPSLRELVEKQNWPIGHVVLLARLRHETQVIMLETIKKKQKTQAYGWVFWNGSTRISCPPTLLNLRQCLEGFERVLSSARWKLSDDTLVTKAGSCTECPKRSSLEGHLFQEPGDNPKHDKCLDAKCWKEKEEAMVQLSISKIKLRGDEPIYLGNDREEMPAGIDKVSDLYDFQLVKKTTPGAKPAVMVNGNRVGEVCYVKPMTSSAGTMKSHRTVNQETGKKQGPSTKERLQSLTNKRLCAAVEFWRIYSLYKLKPTLKNLLPVLGTVGTSLRKNYLDQSDWKEHAELIKLKDFDLSQQLWQEVFPVLADRTKRIGTLEDGEKLWQEAVQQAEAIEASVELLTCWDSAIQEVKFPKSLQKDGAEDPHKPGHFPILGKPLKKKG